MQGVTDRQSGALTVSEHLHSNIPDSDKHVLIIWKDNTARTHTFAQHTHDLYQHMDELQYGNTTCASLLNVHVGSALTDCSNTPRHAMPP